MHVFLFIVLFLFANGSSSTSLQLLKGGNVYTPDPIGKASILIGGEKILAIIPESSKTFQKKIELSTNWYAWMVTDCLSVSADLPIETIDVSGLNIFPGFIDLHVHVTGGGGELGPGSRTPEAQLDELINAGTTTVIGLLGTDSVSRSLENLLTKLTGLEEQGITSFMWTGAYRVPAPTITESVMRDIMLIEKIIGVGEVAISDHRSSNPTFDEISRMVADARVGGMLSNKAGKVQFHVGEYKTKLDLLWRVVNETPIPITQMLPTHMSSRGQALLEEGKKWIKAGGYCDFTADQVNETDTLTALLDYKKNQVPLSQLTLSSDSYGSFPTFDSQGNVVSYDYAKPDSLLNTFRTLVLDYKWPIDQAIQLSTRNPAKFLKLKGKGELKEGYDANLIAVNSTFQVQYMFTNGQAMKTPTWIKKPMFRCL